MHNARRAAIIKNVCICLLLPVISGCAQRHFFVNQRVGDASSGRPYYIEQHNSASRSDELLVVLAFSGGGMRASALSYGVLEVLAETRIDYRGRQTRLLDEVDLVSAVSGGSFTAAYYGLYGQRVFEDFEKKFLRADIQGALVKRVFSPFRWYTLSSRYYDRSELAEAYFNEILFDGATYDDLAHSSGPAVLINATDLTLGTGFGFSQTYFDWMCSDLSTFPISRAVTASSAVPGLFSAVTLFNYGSECDAKVPSWYGSEIWSAHPQLKPTARKVDAYLNSVERPYIHLMDGGLADNLGLRAIMEMMSLRGTAADTLEAMGVENTRKVIVIVANAAPFPSPAINKKKNPPSIMFSVDAATTIQIARYNTETMALFREQVGQWQEQVSLARCGRMYCRDNLELYLVSVSLSDIADPEKRRALQEIPTTFTLTDAEVDSLIVAARELLADSPDFQRLLRDLGSD